MFEKSLKVDNKKIGFRKNLSFLHRFRRIHSNKEKIVRKKFGSVLSKKVCIGCRFIESNVVVRAHNRDQGNVVHAVNWLNITNKNRAMRYMIVVVIIELIFLSFSATSHAGRR